MRTFLKFKLYLQVKFKVSWDILPRSSLTIRSTETVLMFPKNTVHSGSNGMRIIFLLLTQAAQFEC